MDPSFEDMDRVFKAIDEQYHMKAIARTVRYVHSGSNNSLKAFYSADGRLTKARHSILRLLTVLVVEMHSLLVLSMLLCRMTGSTKISSISQ